MCGGLILHFLEQVLSALRSVIDIPLTRVALAIFRHVQILFSFRKPLLPRIFVLDWGLLKLVRSLFHGVLHTTSFIEIQVVRLG